MVFLALQGFCISTTGLESFLSGQKSSPKVFLSVVVVYVFSSLKSSSGMSEVWGVSEAQELPVDILESFF